MSHSSWAVASRPTSCDNISLSLIAHISYEEGKERRRRSQVEVGKGEITNHKGEPWRKGTTYKWSLKFIWILRLSMVCAGPCTCTWTVPCRRGSPMCRHVLSSPFSASLRVFPLGLAATSHIPFGSGRQKKRPTPPPHSSQSSDCIARTELDCRGARSQLLRK
jgi:hypothetical protein